MGIRMMMTMTAKSTVTTVTYIRVSLMLAAASRMLSRRLHKAGGVQQQQTVTPWGLCRLFVQQASLAHYDWVRAISGQTILHEQNHQCQGYMERVSRTDKHIISLLQVYYLVIISNVKRGLVQLRKCGGRSKKR